MTKKKNIASKLVLVLFVLTLISCCLLGSTFARYVSGGTGSASIGIAKWDVDFVNGSQGDTLEFSFSKLSPEMRAWSSSEETGWRRNDCGVTYLGCITNGSDVSADVSFAQSDLTYEGTALGNGLFGGSMNEAPNDVQMDKVFTLTLYYNLDGGTSSYNVVNAGKTVTLAQNESVYLFANLTWTSLDEYGAVVADAVDTWIGENITEVGASISWTAVQASELPKATP